MIVCQFSGYHSFLPVIFSKILNKPSLIISGGTDCVAFPSIGYGNFNKNFLGLFTAFSFKYCTHISPVHQSLMISDYTYQTNDYSQQGLLFFHPEITTPYTVIYNDYDSSKWCRVKEKRKNLFLTVAAGLYMPFSKQLKGIDLILEIANDFPQCEFMIIGADEKIMNCGISNLIGVPYVENEKLPEYYSQAEFYLQRFAHLMRGVLENSKKELIGLDKEMEYLQTYIDLERVRLRNIFSYNISIPQNGMVDKIFIPTMLLQPFVENAIWHGLTTLKERKGKIDIHVECLEFHTLITISDNGIGRKKSAELKAGKTQLKQSFGISIVKERIYLFNRQYHKKISIQIIDLIGDDNEPIGTRVELKIK